MLWFDWEMNGWWQFPWSFRKVHPDVWDYDAPSPTVLFDQVYNGLMRKGLYQAGEA